VIVGFNVMLLILLEVPLLGYFFAPERTVAEVQRFRAWLTRSGRRMAIYGAAGLGVLLIGRGVIEYIT
jgi:Sap, sulfolipid-1-addressing protein